MTAGAVAAAAATARTRRRMLAALRDKGALSPMTATDLPLPGWRERRMLERLMRRGVVVQVGPDRYYLDEAQLAAMDAARGKVLLWLMGAVVLMSAVGGALVYALVGQH